MTLFVSSLIVTGGMNGNSSFGSSKILLGIFFDFENGAKGSSD